MRDDQRDVSVSPPSQGMKKVGRGKAPKPHRRESQRPRVYVRCGQRDKDLTAHHIQFPSTRIWKDVGGCVYALPVLHPRIREYNGEKPQDPPQVCRSQAHSIVTAHKTHPSSVQKAQINTLPSARLLPFPTRFSISSVDVDVCGSTEAPWPIGFKLGTSSERGWVCERASRERELRLGYANTEKRTWKARGLVIRL